MIDKPDGCAVFQRDLNQLEKWTDRCIGKFSKRNCKVLHPWRTGLQTLDSRHPQSDWELRRREAPFQKRTYIFWWTRSLI